MRELIDLDLASDRRQPTGATVDIPGVRLDLLLDEMLRSPVGVVVRSVRAPNPWRALPASDPTTDVSRGEVPDVVGMQVADEHLVDQVIRDLEHRQVRDRSSPDVEDELLAVA